ncbi:MAG: MFS transporter [Alphaproteobacteria bacterium]|nr:MAG: MFS transporter [Alphaproteobacteria bacterium]
MGRQFPWIQARIVALCMLVNMLDGFDILAMAYSAPAVASEWGLDPEQLGILFSLGLGGMMAGSIFISPLADRFGRRPVIIACLSAAIASMALAGSAPDLTTLAFARLLTGMAIGGTLPCINTMAAEYSSSKSRTLAVSLTQAGFPLGASLGGFLAVWLLDAFNWQSIFLAGAIVSALLLPVIYLWMPESAAFEQGKAQPASERKSIAATDSGKGQLADLLSYRAALALLVLCFFASVMGVYFLFSWLPKILTDVGMEQGDAVLAGALLTSGGLVSALAIGWLAMTRPLVKIIAVGSALSAILTFLTGQLADNGSIIFLVAFLVGVTINGVQIGLYAAVPSMFPAGVRAGGTGFAIGLGRGGAVLGPWLTGVLIARGWSPEQLFALMSVPYLLLAVLVLMLARWQRY